MKDEIKEILDYIKEQIKKETLSYEPDVELSKEEAKLLLDYITKLQEQQNQFASTINELGKSNVNLQNRNIELVLENDRLKENAEHNDKVVDKARWNEMIYKSRNEKANTLLNEMLERAYIDGEYIMYDYSTSELLEVKQALQGEDKENLYKYTPEKGFRLVGDDND